MTPWDAGGVPPKLAQWLRGQPAGMRVLVPGCGAGYEVKLFAEHGDDVLGIDFSDAALAAAQRVLGAGAGLVRKADFFAIRETYDLVYERTFLCALPRPRWPQWAESVAGRVRPAGRLAGFFFFDDNRRGPPFGIAREALHGLLDGAFRLIEDEAIPEAQSVEILKGRERWQVWQRRL